METLKELYPKVSTDGQCTDYEAVQGPQLVYEKNNTQFCRTNPYTRKKPKQGAKLAENGSCKKYEATDGPQTLYTRNGVQYCKTRRKKTTTEKKTSPAPAPVPAPSPQKEPQTPKEPKEVKEAKEVKEGKEVKEVKEAKDPYTACKDSSKADLKELAYLFNVDDPEKICGMMQSWRFKSNPSLKQVKTVASSLGIKIDKYSSKSGMEKKAWEKVLKTNLMNSIKEKTKDNLRPSFMKWLEMEQPGEPWNEKTTQWLVVLLHKVIAPEGVAAHAPIEISDELYEHYINELWKEDAETRKLLFDDDETKEHAYAKLDPNEIAELKDALLEKFSSCVSKFVFKNRVQSVLSNKDGLPQNDPIKVCRKSVLERPRKVDDKEETFTKVPFDISRLLTKCDPLVKKDLGM